MSILTDLNPAQREAVEAIEGPLLILAGPGAGFVMRRGLAMRLDTTRPRA